MDYKELIKNLKEEACHQRVVFGSHGVSCQLEGAADAIESLLAERDAAVEDLTTLGQDSGDSCHLCKHLPCMDENGKGHCIGFEWRGPQKGEPHASR